MQVKMQKVRAGVPTTFGALVIGDVFHIPSGEVPYLKIKEVSYHPPSPVGTQYTKNAVHLATGELREMADDMHVHLVRDATFTGVYYVYDSEAEIILLREPKLTVSA